MVRPRNNIRAVVILAGGAGSRYAGTKQLAPIGQKPMVRHIVDICAASSADVIIACLGAKAESVLPAIEDADIEVTVAHDWQEGMSASIRHAVSYALEHSAVIDALMIVLGDQPGITTELLDNLWQVAGKYPDKMIATGYHGLAGPPAIFPRSAWPGMLNLTGDTGARDILRRSDSTLVVEFPDAGEDVDTVDDL